MQTDQSLRCPSEDGLDHWLPTDSSFFIFTELCVAFKDKVFFFILRQSLRFKANI